VEVSTVRSLYVEPEPEAEETSPAVQLLDVFRIFSSGSSETVALRGLSVTIGRGVVVAVHGPSGSGKSTFLHLVAGLDSPSAGEVRVFGRPLDRLNDDELSGYRAEIGLVFQKDNLIASLTALENVELALRLAGATDVRNSALEALAQVGLDRRSGHRPGALSGGEQQRVAIAAAAARRPRLILADEPTGELDTDNERIVLDALVGLRDRIGSTVVIVTHSGRAADRVDEVVELRDGRAA
jgi:putative ABC transport system ATP-binding protein